MPSDSLLGTPSGRADEPSRTPPRTPPTSTAAPRDVAALLRLLAADPGRPRLTWYGDDGERVEISGAVLGNWVAKTTNLLVEELDAAPGTRVGCDLPPHWRTVLWALATWRAGATLVPLDDPAADAAGLDVLLSTDGARGEADALVVVTLAALARRAAVPLPPGAVDAAAAVMTYGDQLGWVPPTEPARVALGDVTFADLPAWWAGEADARPRVLLTAAAPLATHLRDVLRALAADGSVVLLSPGRAEQLADDPVARERLVATERVTRVA